VSKRVEKIDESRESKSLDEEIEDEKSARKKDCGQLSKQKKSTVGCFGAPREKEGKIGWQSLENMGQVDLGF
jgi:hypothetical protein